MAVSSSTHLWDSLFYLYMAIALAIGGAVIAWLVVSMIKFRAKPGDPRPADAPRPGVIPAERGHVLWVYVMAGAIAAIMFSLAFSTISAIDTIEHPPEGEPAVHVNVIGFQFGWKFNYTGTDGIPFQRIGELTVPARMNVIMNITSQDVWHNFALTNFRLRVDAIPGEVTHLWFNADDVGKDFTVCVQLCGTGHAAMRATMNITSQADFATWLAEQSEKEFASLAKSTRNVTITAGALQLDNATVTPTKGGVALLVSNTDSSPHVLVMSKGTSATVPAGGSVRMWLPAAKGETIELSSKTLGSITLGVS